MAKSKTAPAYDEAAAYDVKLTRVVRIIGTSFAPLPVHEMTGWLLNRIVAQEGADVVDSAYPRT